MSLSPAGFTGVFASTSEFERYVLKLYLVVCARTSVETSFGGIMPEIFTWLCSCPSYAALGQCHHIVVAQTVLSMEQRSICPRSSVTAAPGFNAFVPTPPTSSSSTSTSSVPAPSTTATYTPTPSSSSSRPTAEGHEGAPSHQADDRFSRVVHVRQSGGSFRPSMGHKGVLGHSSSLLPKVQLKRFPNSRSRPDKLLSGWEDGWYVKRIMPDLLHIDPLQPPHPPPHMGIVRHLPPPVEDPRLPEHPLWFGNSPRGSVRAPTEGVPSIPDVAGADAPDLLNRPVEGPAAAQDFDEFDVWELLPEDRANLEDPVGPNPEGEVVDEAEADLDEAGIGVAPISDAPALPDIAENNVCFAWE
ncbi:hypothetical protein FOL47_001451 [Perkinsus chesapeaki]|uniref:SWIM-type domain-containing protein n=1 Tax=Perkinsus chesapeaki TaxID=330153 RepID=A0A7J6KSR0_PERCH|nr:hypothetical protein FOL47_001451 [Perkinsus chesapeaki]